MKSFFTLFIFISASSTAVLSMYHHVCHMQPHYTQWKGKLCGTKLISVKNTLCMLHKQQQKQEQMEKFIALMTEPSKKPFSKHPFQIKASRLSKRSAEKMEEELKGQDIFDDDEEIEEVVELGNKKDKSLEHLDNFIMSNSDALSIVHSHYPRRLFRSGSYRQKWTPQNIVCECCYNECNHEELLEYC